jgi:hypothetical protein
MVNQNDIASRPRVRKLKRVKPIGYYTNTCFIEAFASCLGSTYEHAFKLAHPDKSIETSWNHGIHPLRALEVANKHLRMFREAKERRFKDFKTNALIIIQWSNAPELAHALVWNHKKQLIIGSLGGTTRAELERQIFKVHYFKRPIVQAKE